MALFPRGEKTPLGIYIHVPFCRSKCLYCDFYSLPGKADHRMRDYLKAVVAHIKDPHNAVTGECLVVLILNELLLEDRRFEIAVTALIVACELQECVLVIGHEVDLEVLEDCIEGAHHKCSFF